MHDPETAATGALYRLDPDGSCHRMVDGIVISNSLCWSPDGRTMYHADTMRRTVWAWDSDPDRGEIANRRVFVQLSGDEGSAGRRHRRCRGLRVARALGRVAADSPRSHRPHGARGPAAGPAPHLPAFGGPDLDVLLRHLR
mgnify:CR=1 FL=1